MRISKSDIEALAQFRYALRQFLRFSERAARQAGITPQQHQLLMTIKGMQGRNWANVAEVAERLQVSHHAAVALVTRAQNLKLVKRTQGKKDRRTVQVSLTARGEDLISQLAEMNHHELGQLANILLKQLQSIAASARRRS
ncbi:MAG TPA: MarR family transcriptional regulator [Terriglobales bacterium]|nr:MarR family transcriptional regulator [Terriglobales bacterium]